MKPPDDKMPEEMRNWIKEQMPWLNNPNNTIPTADPADIKALWQQSKDLEAHPVNQERARFLPPSDWAPHHPEISAKLSRFRSCRGQP